jgi:hypothetical protein
MHIGMLEEIDIRELWKHEQYNFSNWLAEPENISYLNDILGLTLVDINKEMYVGSYRCDIVAKDEANDTTVIIENQLEETNHDHLGKIITYASGLDAKVVVWIVKKAKEEHRSAIEWLNNNTRSGIDFFLLEIHAYRIGDSDPAPKFEIIEQPNDFIKYSKISAAASEYNKSQSERIVFWTRLNESIIARGKPFNTRKPSTDHWYNVAIGSSSCCISVALVNSDSFVGIELYIPKNKALFDELYKHKDEIDQLINLELDWERLDGKKASRIRHKIYGLDFDNHDNYPQLMDEIIDKVVLFRNVFQQFIR